MQNAGEKVPCPNNHGTRADRKARISTVEHPRHPYARTAWARYEENSASHLLAFESPLPLKCGSGTAMTQGSASDAGTAVKDKDPPPAFDGRGPDAFRTHCRDIKLWQWETDIPKQKHAVKMLRQLSGAAQAADEPTIEQLQSDEGAKLIIQKLEEQFTPHLYAAMPGAFERAIHGDPRRSACVDA